MTKVKSTTSKPQSTLGKPAGLPVAQEKAYAKKLIGADLAKERGRAQKLKAEGTAEKSPALVATANDRLELIVAEAKTRAQLGPAGAALAAKYSGKTDSQ